MTGRTAENFILFGYAGLLIISFSLAMRGRDAPFLCRSTGGFALRRPWEHCACLGLYGLLPLLLPLLMVSDDLRFYGAVRSDHWPSLWAFTGIGLAGAAFFWWISRPTEFAVDEGRRTYRWSEGWPPFRRIRTGPLSDLEGVWAAEDGSDHRPYLVYVARQGGTGRMVVEGFSSAAGAEHYADELAAVLAVPRLMPGACRWPQFSGRRQRAWAGAADARPPYRRCRRYRLHLGE